MRFIFKTSYNQDIRLAKHGGHAVLVFDAGAVPGAAPWISASTCWRR
jgi:branched-chain amino acid transport system permease protein